MNIQKGYGEYDEAPKNCTIDQNNLSEKEDTLRQGEKKMNLDFKQWNIKFT